jgi:hypothetical protein
MLELEMSVAAVGFYLEQIDEFQGWVVFGLTARERRREGWFNPNN